MEPGGYPWRAYATQQHFLDPAKDESGEGLRSGLETEPVVPLAAVGTVMMVEVNLVLMFQTCVSKRLEIEHGTG